MPSAPYQFRYGLKEHPFSLKPDPRFIFLGAPHKEALAHLLYGLGTDGGGIVLLTGAPGSGKTLLCRAFRESVGVGVDVASVDDPAPDAEGLLAAICTAFGLAVPAPASVKQLVDRLNVFLQANHARGRRSVLLVDGAHRLGVDVLEQLRLLTNLETHERKLLQVLLVGRPELQETVERHDLRQLAQRVIARCRLRPLGVNEVAGYVHHRLAVAGGNASIVPASLAPHLHASTQGVPRTLNLLCDRALLGASLRGEAQLGVEGLQRAAHELGLPAAKARAWRRPSLAIAATVLVTVCAAGAIVAGHERHAPVTGDVVSASTSWADEPDDTPAAEPAGAPASAAAGDERVALAGGSGEPEDFAWPEGLSHPRSAAPAYSGLLQRWGASAAGAGTACAGRLPEGLRCLRGRAGLAELKSLDLPAVLHLDDGRGRRIDALLSKVEGDALVVEVAGTPRRLSVAALRDWWHGEYSMVWRAPAGPDLLLPGSRGPAVLWLRERLAQWRGQASLPGTTFDATLQRALREFQMAEGLEPDGVAGMKTLARLGARTDPATPTLGPAVAAVSTGTTTR